MRSAVSTFGITPFICSVAIFAQVDSLDMPISLSQIDISGPRLGIIAALTHGPFLDSLRVHKMDRVVSEFGWHFEYKIVPHGGGPAFVVEFIPLIGATEYGCVIPSVSLPMGVRLPNGFEFGLGPHLSFIVPEPVNSALVAAIGKTFLYRGVGIPINIAAVKGKGGYSGALMFGYAIVKSARKRPGMTKTGVPSAISR